MPQAGWCRECGEWVWVDDEGGCQHGHGPECVEKIHEQAEPALSERPFGVGRLPLGLRRFNWGAFLLPLFWGAAYGLWPVVSAWLLAALTPIVLALMFATEGRTTLPFTTFVGIAVVSEMVAGLTRLWAGANANRLLWRREALRLELVPTSQPRFSTERYSARQRNWVLWGGALMLIGTAVGVPLAIPTWQEYGLTYVGAFMPLVWLAAEVMLAFWLDVRMRMEPPDAEQPARGII